MPSLNTQLHNVCVEYTIYLHCCWEATQSCACQVDKNLIFNVYDMSFWLVWMCSEATDFKMTSLEWYSTCTHSLQVCLTLWWTFYANDDNTIINDCVECKLYTEITCIVSIYPS